MQEVFDTGGRESTPAAEILPIGPRPGTDPDGPTSGGAALSAVPALRVTLRPAVLIHCPRGPQPQRTGYAIYAARFTVDEDGAPDIEAAVSLDHTDSVMRAQALSLGYALHPEKYGIAGMDAVIVNDGAGSTVLRRDLQPAA